MRNIAILEWGPASLYYVQPRETIKVRTGWLEGGPLMPPFLSTKDEAKQSNFRVRYALSYHENLDKVVRNLRRCFGFPYQEAIGFLNSLNRSHRVRREHEGLTDRLRQWAIFGNVDAIVWIDYEKANQRRGEFKLGPKDSRPFSPKHIELVGQEQIADEDGEEESDGERSEAGGGGGQQQQQIAAPPGGPIGVVGTGANAAEGTLAIEGGGLTQDALAQGGLDMTSPSRRGEGFLRPLGVELQRQRGAALNNATAPEQAAAAAGGGSPGGSRTPRVGGAPRRGELARVAAALDQKEQQQARGGGGGGGAGGGGEAPKAPPLGAGEGAAGGAADEKSEEGSVRGGRHGGGRGVVATRTENQAQHKMLRTLQPEEVPSFGSIYPRSFAPGPGHYATAASAIDAAHGRSFGYKPVGRLDVIARKSKLIPGPGHYPSPQGLTEVKIAGGPMDEAAKGSLPIQGENLLPFLSPTHAFHESLGLHSPNIYYTVRAADAEASHGVRKAPAYSFGHTPRPFQY